VETVNPRKKRWKEYKFLSLKASKYMPSYYGMLPFAEEMDDKWKPYPPPMESNGYQA
jgi:hypothetical protein